MGVAKRLKAARLGKITMEKPKRVKMRELETDPLFKDVFRKFMTKVHPDLFSKFPELREQNESSTQQLQEILGQAKSGQHETEMPVTRRDLVFFVRTDSADHYRRIPFELRTTGSNCRHVLGRAMGQLFGQCGLPAEFRWGPEYWERTVYRPETKKEEE